MSIEIPRLESSEEGLIEIDTLSGQMLPPQSCAIRGWVVCDLGTISRRARHQHTGHQKDLGGAEIAIVASV